MQLPFKNYFFLLLMLVPATCCFAKLNPDSLWGIWNNQSLPIENQLGALDLIIKDVYLSSKPDSAFYYAQTEFDLAENAGLKKYSGKALTLQGLSFRIRGELDKSFDYLNRALKIFEEGGFKREAAGCLNYIGNIYSMKEKADSAFLMYDKALKIANEIKDTATIGAIYNSLGIQYKNSGDYAKAIESYLLSLKAAEELADDLGIGRSLTNIASVYQFQGYYVKALEYYFRSLKLFEKIDNPIAVSTAYSNIGVVYYYQKEHLKAIEYYEKSLEIQRSLKNINGVATNLNQIGKCYYEIQDYPKALEYFNNALTIDKEKKYKREEAKVLGNLSSLNLKTDETGKAIEYAKQALEINREIKDNQGIAVSLGQLGHAYLAAGNYLKAISNFQESLQIGQEIGSAVEIKNASKGLYESYKNTGNANLALRMYELYNQTRDSMINEANSKEIARAEFKYAYDKKALADSLQSAAQLQAVELNRKVEVEQKEKERNMYLSAAVLILLLTFLFYQRSMNKNKLQTKEMEAAYQKELMYATINSEEKERRRIARDLHDEVGAMLSTIKMNLGAVNIKLKKSGVEEDLTASTRNLLDDTITNVRQISKDLLPPTLEEFGLAQALNELAIKVEEASGIKIEKDIVDVKPRLATERELALYRVIQEMMNNAIKHSGATQFELVMREKYGMMQLSFADNGKGFDLNVVKKSKAGMQGLGLKNLENRVGAAGGTMTYTTAPGKGSRIDIALSVAELKSMAA